MYQRLAFTVVFLVCVACGSSDDKAAEKALVDDPKDQCADCGEGMRSDPVDCSCSDIDECKTNNGDCDEKAQCTNAVKSGDAPICVCPEKYFGDGTACTEYSTCADTEYESMAPTDTADRACTALTECSDSEYESAAATATSDRACTALTECSDTEYESTAPTATSDRACTALTECSDTEYESTAPTATSDRACTALTECSDTEYESAAPTATSDRTCTALTECSDTEYESTPPTATTDRICTPLNECTEGQYVVAEATENTDLECADLTVCNEGEYEKVAPTKTSDRVCEVFSTCTDKEFQSQAGTPTSDVVCLPVTECGEDSYQTAPATPTSNTQCAAYDTVPGLVQAEDYAKGGEGVGYHDATPGNSGGEYRDDDVDIVKAGDGFAVPMQSGEWLTYTLYVKETGKVQMTLWATSELPGKRLHITVDGAPLALNVRVPTTDSPIVIKRLTLTQGLRNISVWSGATDGVVLDAFETQMQDCEDKDSDGFCADDDCQPDNSQCAQGLCCRKLVGHWAFDETEGKVAADSSGNGNDGKLDDDTQSTWTKGIIGNALTVTGGGDAVDVPNAESLEVGDTFTVSAWVWMSTAKKGGTFFNLRNKTDAMVRVVSSKDVRRVQAIACDAYLSTWPTCDVTGLKVFSPEQWHHVVFVVEGTELKLYLDGVLEAGGYIDANTAASYKDPLVIGSTFVGSLDDVRLYDDVLTAEDVATLYYMSPEQSTQCSDGKDNDGNGVMDMGSDLGCASIADDNESALLDAPSAPESLQVVAAHPTMIHLTWSPLAEEQELGGYNIYRDGVRVDTVMRPTFYDTQITTGTSYNYAVSAMSISGIESPKTEVVSAKADAWPTFDGAETITVTPTEFPGFTSLKKLIEGSPEGTTFIFKPGVYRFKSVIFPRKGQSLIGQKGAIFSGAIALEPDDLELEDGLYRWSGINIKDKTYQQPGSCEEDSPACKYQHDLYFNDVALKQVMTEDEVVEGTFYTDYDPDGSTVIFKDDPTGKNVELSFIQNALRGSPNEVCCDTVDGFEWLPAKQCPSSDIQKDAEDIKKCGDDTCTPYCNSHVTIRGLIIEKFATVAQRGAIMAREYTYKGAPMYYWVVEQNEIRWNHGSGVHSGAYSILRNNKIHHNGQIGGTVGTHSVMEGNEFSHNNWAGYKIGWEAGALKVVANHYTVIRGNHIHHNHGHGLWVDIDNHHLVLENNVSHHNKGDGYKYEISYDCAIRHNTGVSNHDSPTNSWLWGSFIMVQNSERCEVYNNWGEVTQLGNGITVLNQNREDKSKGVVYEGINNAIHRNRVTYTGANGRSGAQNANNIFQFNHYDILNPYYQYFATPYMPFHLFQQAGHDEWGVVAVNPTPEQPIWNAPTVMFVSPKTEHTVACDEIPTFELSATSDSGDAVARIDLWLDNTLLAQTSLAPYKMMWFAPEPGTYSIVAKAHTMRGQQAQTQPISLTVQACP